MNITIENVSKSFKVQKGREVEALHSVSLKVEDSRFVSIIGPSGCGKSTLLYLVSGLDTPTSGSIRFEGKKTSAGPLTAIVWQEYALMPWRSVLSNVVYGLELQRRDRKESDNVAEKYIRLVGIEGFEKHYPHQLSGGMKQRVGLARALASEPEFLLMDEPFASVDAQTRIILQEELLRIWDQTRKTLLFVTHSIDEAIILSDYIALMTRRPGRIKEIFQVTLPRPRTMEVQGSPDFIQLRTRIWELLREDFMASRE